MFAAVLFSAFFVKAQELAGEPSPKNTVPIVMAMDNNFTYPTAVCISSVLENASENTEYQFYLLVSSDLLQENKNKFEILSKKYGSKIEFVNVEDVFKKSHTLSYISSATYYRLKIPQALPFLDKCIYLDGDIVVTGDLAELFNINIENYYIAGSKAPIYRSLGSGYTMKLGLKDMNDAVNAGVLVMNIKKMREDNIEEKFNKFLKAVQENKMFLADQDVLNASCHEKIFHFPLKYNMGFKLRGIDMSYYKRNKNMQECHTAEDFEAALKNPVVIHYCGPNKPWEPQSYDSLWWKYALATPFAKEIEAKYKTVRTKQ